MTDQQNTANQDALNMVRAARQGDMDTAGAIFERTDNPGVLTGALIGMILEMANAAVRQWGGGPDTGTYIDALLEETLRGEPSISQPDRGEERASVEASATVRDAPGDCGPAWMDELGMTAAAALVAVLDQDSTALTAVLGTCTREEAVNVTAGFARAFAACIAPEDRADARDSLRHMLQDLGGTPGSLPEP